MSRYCKTQGQVLSDMHICKTCPPLEPSPRGIRVIHEAPGAPIEIAMWWMDGRRESVWTSDKALHVFMADLATALSRNSLEPRAAGPALTKEN